METSEEQELISFDKRIWNFTLDKKKKKIAIGFRYNSIGVYNYPSFKKLAFF